VTYTKAGEVVTIEITQEDYWFLLLLLGQATGSLSQQGERREFWDAIDFVNRMNRTNPEFTQYEIPEGSRGVIANGGAQ